MSFYEKDLSFTYLLRFFPFFQNRENKESNEYLPIRIDLESKESFINSQKRGFFRSAKFPLLWIFSSQKPNKFTSLILLSKTDQPIFANRKNGRLLIKRTIKKEEVG